MIDSGLSSSVRKRTWDNFTNYIKEQWTGFPPELQSGASRVNKRVGPFVGSVVKDYKEVGKAKVKGTAVDQLRKIPFRSPYTGPNAFQPKPKVKAKPKTTWTDIILSRKEQEQIRQAREAIPDYLKPKKKVKE